MSKTYYRAFSEEWFKKNQRVLLFLLNAPVIKHWFRWVLRIRKYDCPLDVKITAIAPNRFSFGCKYFKKKNKWYLKQTTDFRTHQKFSKRIYFAFKPIWWMFHFWDWVFADRLIPQLSLGFSTLTVYPAAGANSPVDGEVARQLVDEAWATIHDNANGNNGGNTTATTADAGFEFSTTTGQYKFLWRSIFLFDTSGLTSVATLSAAVFSLWGSNKFDSATALTPTIDIYTSTPAANNTLGNADYSQIGTTSQTGSAKAYSSYSIVAYNDFTFNATGIGNISLTSISKFAAREAKFDAANSEPGTWASLGDHYFVFRMADQTGTSNDPKLVVTYTLPTVPSGGYASNLALMQ